MFEPYIIPIKLERFYEVRFLIATEQARDWYDPPKPYTLLEYQWVVDNVKRRAHSVDHIAIDAGCHHGHYSVVLERMGFNVCAVDAHPSNCAITTANTALNHPCLCHVSNSAVAGAPGTRHFSGISNGQLVNSGGVEVEAQTLERINPIAELVKLDVEGAEFEIIPASIDKLPECKTWIIEIHPREGEPDTIIQPFIERGYEVLKVDRELMQVRPYVIGEPWYSHATVIARRA